MTSSDPFVGSDAPPELPIIQQLRQQLRGLLTVRQVDVREEPKKMITFTGHLKDEPDAVFERVTERFEALGFTAMLWEVPEGGHQILAFEGVFEEQPRKRWVNLALLLATVLSTMLAGLSADIDLSSPTWYLSGLPFAAALMAILLAHELAHYFVARRYGSPVSLPYFIPLPISILGTMGAVIVQRAPMRSRKALFDIGIAGPLAGFVLAVPLLIVGLLFTQVGRPAEFVDEGAIQARLAAQCAEPEGVQAVFCTLFYSEDSEGSQYFQEGNSLLYLAAKLLTKGRILPSADGEDVWLSHPSPGGPVVFAAWAGLLVTALNLLPIGQLDGGHVAYALLGRRAWTLAFVAVGGLALLAGYLFLMGNPAWITWAIWAGLGFFMNPRHPPPLNDASRLNRRRIVLGILVAVILALTFVPAPMIPTG
jgi:membrane-associated protease RseP (regulator of RpoE activity)